MYRRRINTILVLLLILAIAVNLAGCAVSGQETGRTDAATESIAGEHTELGDAIASAAGKAADEAFVQNQMRFTAELFRTAAGKKKENVLLSPLSVQLSLAMSANGAKGKTLSEMEKLLGGKLEIGELNEYLYTYVGNLPNDRYFQLEIANSIWLRDHENSLKVKEDFLQKCEAYYGAQVYKAAFNEETVQQINAWVKEHTNGKIDQILDRINAETVMYLINALTFDASWQTAYYREMLYEGTFQNILGEDQKVEMMRSIESLYLEDAYAVGFIKPYQYVQYSFVALLPNADVDIHKYISKMTGEKLQSLLENPQVGSVNVDMPKFSYEYTLSMNEILADLGMPTAFHERKADFSGMAESPENIHIEEVLHKTTISVDVRGTSAGALSSVRTDNESSSIGMRSICIDRPFIFMIIDNATKLPLFIGTVMDIPQ